jgi:glucokinase
MVKPVTLNEKEYLIGVDLGGTNLRVAAISMDGKVLDNIKESTNLSRGYSDVVDRIRSLINSITRKKSLPPTAVGLAAPGAINTAEMVITSSPNFPEWEKAPLADDVGRGFSFPVYLENDANAAALGESWIGVAKEWNTFAMFTLGTGVGGGIILNGDCWRGPDGMAAEFGHLTIHPNGRLCGCGNSGCLETTASASGVAIRGKELLGKYFLDNQGVAKDEISAELVTNLAKKGNADAKSILDDAGSDLGIAMAHIVLSLGVTKFVIGGGMASAFYLMRSSMRNSALSNSYTLTPKRLKIVEAGLGNEAGVIGAAHTAMIQANKT